jgi:hypothetical protein
MAYTSTETSKGGFPPTDRPTDQTLMVDDDDDSFIFIPVIVLLRGGPFGK